MSSTPFYSGKVRHRRTIEKKHQFSYQVFMFYFDVAEIKKTFCPYPWISLEKFNLMSFYRRNYLGNKEIPLDQAIRETVEKKLNFYPKGRIFLLTNLSCLGYCVNPISFYFIFKENSSALDLILVEVTNTPWGEKYVYILDKPLYAANDIYQYQFKKALHVSPFLNMNYEYKIHVKINDDHIIVHLDSHQQDKKHFDATLALKPSKKTLLQVWWYPLMTLKVIIGIYWQALKLWCKCVTFYPNPRKIKDERDGK